MKRVKVNVITMGCFKNLVDSERLLKRFAVAGIDAVHNANDFVDGIVVINTCGFICDAKQESLGMILQACQLKGEGRLKAVYVMGCLSERYRDELPPEIPEVDGWYGKFDWDGIIDAILGKVELPVKPWERVLTTPNHSAYLKIAEGCNRFCAFCAIPIMTGRYRSRSIEEIVDEVKDLVSRGVKEFNVIAQDLSYYGRDLYGKSELAHLLEAIADVEGVKWIRLHYAYPADFPYDILPVMASRENICKYLDIALQHIDDQVLKNMHRHIDARETRELLARIRREVPGINIRTTLMVGFPGETEEAFNRLEEFVREQRFERMGAFAYCEEEDTAAAREFNDVIPADVKQARLDKIMAIQESIAAEINEEMIGCHEMVIIDSEDEDYYVGRTQFDSPEVDQEVLISKDRMLLVGEMYMVEIIDAQPFELVGKIVD